MFRTSRRLGSSAVVEFNSPGVHDPFKARREIAAAGVERLDVRKRGPPATSASNPTAASMICRVTAACRNRRDLGADFRPSNLELAVQRALRSNRGGVQTVRLQHQRGQCWMTSAPCRKYREL